QQILEREDVCRDRLSDRDLLDTAHVANLPVALWTVRMRVVARDATGAHENRGDVAHAVLEQRPGDIDRLLVRVLAERNERILLEFIERMNGAVLERIVRHEAIDDIRLLLPDDAAELDGKGRGNGNGARNLLVVWQHLGGAMMREHPLDDLRPVIAADAADDRVEVACLAMEGALRQVAEIEPDGGRQSREKQDDKP